MKRLAVLVLMLYAALAPGATYWVHKGGDNGNAGTDTTQAFLTIATAMAVATAGDTIIVCTGTYDEGIASAAHGTSGDRIVLMGYPGETVIITGGASAVVAYQGRDIKITHNYWTLRNLTVKDNVAPTNVYTRYYGVEIGSDNVEIKKVRVLMDGDISSLLTHFGDGYRAMVIWGKSLAMDSSIVRGAVEGIVTVGVPWAPGIMQRAFKRDTIQNTTCNNLMVGGEGGEVGTYQAILFEDCVFDTAGEDNVQMANNGITEPSNAGIIFRRCLMRGAKENAMDMKSAGATVLVENCVLVDSRGDDTPSSAPDLNDDGGGPGVETGMGENPDVSQYAIFRHNLIGGNHSGMRVMPGYHVYNNVFYNNSHSYRGFNTTSGTDFAAIVTDNTGEADAPGSFKRVINNIFYDESTSDIHWAARIFKGFGTNFEIDNNIYFQNTDSTRWLVDYPDGWQNPTTYTGIVDYKAGILDISGWTGKDSRSWASDPEFENVPASPGEYSSTWDFDLQAGSIGLGTSKCLTTATAGATGSTALVVQDAHFFHDGYGITGEIGDSIKIDTAAAVGISSITYSTGLITLTEARDWQTGDSVWLYKNGAVVNNIGITWFAAPPPPPSPTVYDTVSLSWNKGLHDVTISSNTFFQFTNLKLRDMVLILRNPTGKKVAWSDTVTWRTYAPASIPAAITWYTFVRDTSNDLHGAMTGPTSGEAGATSFSAILGNPYDNTALAAVLNAITARLDVIEDSLGITSGSEATGDSVSTSKGTGGTLTFSHRCFGTNRLLVVAVSATWGSVTGVTYNGDAMTCYTDSMYREYSGFTSGVYYLIAPDTGTHNVIVSLSGSLDVVATACGFTGINQTTPINGAAEAEGTDTGPTVNVGSASGDFVLDCVTWNIDGAGTATVGGGQTEQGQDVQGGNCGHAVSTEGGAASVTMSWVIGASREWSIVGVSINRL